MEKEGLSTQKIIKTIGNLVSAKKALNFYKNKALQKHASFITKDKCLINKQIFSEEAGEITFKFFSDIFSLIAGTYYPPRSKKVMSLIDRVKKQIRFKASPRHVPAKVISISDIPRTKNGKIVELAVKNTIEGNEIKNIQALANPEILKEYKNLKELKN